MRPAARITLGIVTAVLVFWLIVAEVERLRQRGQRELAEVRDKAIPDYDCLEEPQPRNAAQNQPTLVDVTEASGLDFTHTVGPLGTYFMPESIGAGAAVFDYDKDGRMDIYFANCGQSPKSLKQFPSIVSTENRLYRQDEDGRFRDVTADSGLGDTGYGAGIAVGDIDNDGFPDVFVANYGLDALYRNNGRGHFENITECLGIQEADWGTAAAFFDYDRDGWLDLLVVNYTQDSTYGHSVACGFQHGLVSYCGPHKFQPTIDRLYHNETGSGDQPKGTVRFRDVTIEAGLGTALTFGFGAICCDLTGDGWPDVFVANDGDANRLWVNQKDGTFREEAQARGIAVNRNGAVEAGMGVAMQDINGDLLPDLLVTHLSKETSTLYLADTAGGFVDQTAGSGIDSATMKHTGWGAALVDMDHDGLLDIPLVNGLVIPCHSGFPFHGEDAFQERSELIENSEEFWKAYADENQLLMGVQDVQFRDAHRQGGDFTAAFGSGRGLTYGDIDNDGDVDLLVTNCGGRGRLYRNDIAKRGHWLSIQTETGDAGRDAIGAKITLQLSGGKAVSGYCVPQTSYLASNDPRVHFGVGEILQSDSIVIEWPDGPLETSIEEFPGGKVDQFLVLRRGTGKPVGRVLSDHPVE
jgi:hypothetical protein